MLYTLALVVLHLVAVATVFVGGYYMGEKQLLSKFINKLTLKKNNYTTK